MGLLYGGMERCKQMLVFVLLFQSYSRMSNSVEFVNWKKTNIQLAACSKNEVLPMKPELPADLFTSCLTSPIKASLRWFVLSSI